EQDRVALGRGIEFPDMRDAEARPEGRPDIRPQAIAAAQPQAMLRLLHMRRRIDEITAELADILEQRAFALDHIIPELADREFLADEHGSALAQTGADGDDAARGMIERQAV